MIVILFVAALASTFLGDYQDSITIAVIIVLNAALGFVQEYNDNFAIIVAAVEQGRVSYDNIRKFIKYLLTSNSAEILVMLAGPFLGLGLPLQILWINLATDGLPALALSEEPAEQGIMRRPPYPPDEGVFARGLGRHVVWDVEIEKWLVRRNYPEKGHSAEDSLL